MKLLDISLVIEAIAYKRLDNKDDMDPSDPMAFWSKHFQPMPILFGIVRRLLPARDCSTDVEQLFSLTGSICSPLRSSLSSDIANHLARLNLWLRDHYKYESTKTATTKLSSKRFVSINVDLSISMHTRDHEEDSEYEFYEHSAVHK